ACSIVSLEIDPAAIAHAAKAYESRGLRQVQGTLAAIPFRPGSFDLVVCFEALEHVAEQSALCAEASRVLRGDGVFLAHSPSRPEYTEATGFQNPFHVKELDLDEFRALLGRYFEHVSVFGQHLYPASAIFPLGQSPSAAAEYLVARPADQDRFRF